MKSAVLEFPKPEIRVKVPGCSWVVPSRSNRRDEKGRLMEYIVWRTSDGFSCNCKAGQCGRECVHVRQIEEMRMIEEAGKRFDGQPVKAEPIRLFVTDAPQDEDLFADVPTLAAKRNAEPAQLLTWRESIALFSDPSFSSPAELGCRAA